MSLIEKFKSDCERRSDINEHLPTIYKYASECSSIVELGSGRTSDSLVTLAAGILNSKEAKESEKRLYYFSVDPFLIGDILQMCCLEDINVKIRRQNIFNIDMSIFNGKEVDMVFIDSDHFFAQTKLELEKFAPLTKKYIVLHDTWIDAQISSCVRMGQNVKEIAARYGLKRIEIERGIRPAVDKFLAANPQWKILEEFENNNGLIVIGRV